MKEAMVFYKKGVPSCRWWR